MVLILTLIAFLTNLINGLSVQEINFNPRQLQKEVTGIFNNNVYKMTELSLRDTTIKSSLSNGKFFTIKSKEGEHIIAYIGRIQSCRAGGCSNESNDWVDTGHEYFDYFIIFDSLKRVIVVRVFNYEATHGQEVTIKKWLDQFGGYDGTSPLRAGKEIDSISGATISVNAIVDDVKEKTSLLSKYQYSRYN